MAVQLLLSVVYLHTEDRHLGGNNGVMVQINSRDFSVGDTTANTFSSVNVTNQNFIMKVGPPPRMGYSIY